MWLNQEWRTVFCSLVLRQPARLKLDGVARCLVTSTATIHPDKHHESSRPQSHQRPATAFRSQHVAAATLETSPNMKPLVGAMQAWTCTVISVFAIVILSIIGGLYRSDHEEFTGGTDDPTDGKAVSGTIFTAVIVYVGFLVFCGLQGLLHVRESRRGAIAL